MTTDHLRRIPAEPPLVSSGALPSPADVQAEVDEAHRRFLDDEDGTVSTGYDALSRVSPELFGGSVVRVNGATYDAGDTGVEFAIMSVAKAFALGMSPADAIDLYTRQSCLAVTADGLAVMGATLADGGVNLRLDDAGNSVRGQLAARFLSQRLGLDLFVSAPAV